MPATPAPITMISKCDFWCSAVSSRALGPSVMLRSGLCSFLASTAATHWTPTIATIRTSHLRQHAGIAPASFTLREPFPNLAALGAAKGNSMRDQFSNTQQIRKPATTSKGGIVAAQSGKAAAVGAGVLAAGGDCADAVIAT